MSLEILIFTIFNGVLYGMFLFMLSCGLTLIFGMMGVLNLHMLHSLCWEHTLHIKLVVL